MKNPNDEIKKHLAREGYKKMLDYTPANCNWQQAIILSEKMCKRIGALKIINIRIARGGCFVTRFLIDIKIVNGIEQDLCTEIKVYDNMPYLRMK